MCVGVQYVFSPSQHNGITKPFVSCSVEGGELFDRIIDENYNLTELDTVLFTRQICEGLQYMHKMYILHLDLKVNLLRLRFSHSHCQ